jgi:dihydroxyacid dehydratase/phosphogluconate dehydratase
VDEGDLIEIHIPERRLAIVGTRHSRLSADELEQLLLARRTSWTSPPPRHTSGILSLYARVAGSTHTGASLT